MQPHFAIREHWLRSQITKNGNTVYDHEYLQYKMTVYDRKYQQHRISSPLRFSNLHTILFWIHSQFIFPNVDRNSRRFGHVRHVGHVVQPGLVSIWRSLHVAGLYTARLHIGGRRTPISRTQESSQRRQQFSEKTVRSTYTLSRSEHYVLNGLCAISQHKSTCSQHVLS